MRQCSDRDIIHATFSISPQRIERDAARRFYFIPPIDNLDRFARVFKIEIVQHDAVDSSDPQDLLQLIQIAYFNFYLQILVFLLQIVVTACDSRFDTAGEINMVVFQENHVE